MKPDFSGKLPARLPSLRRASVAKTIAIVAVVVAVTTVAFTLGWIGAPKTQSPSGTPLGPAQGHYGSPIAFSNPQCIVNCVARAFGTVDSGMRIAFNVSDLNGSLVAFQLTVTNVGVNESAPFRFYLLGGEVTGIIFYPTYLNTTYIDSTYVPPLAPAPSAGDNVTVTLFLIPKDASSFVPTRGEFFWLNENPTDTSKYTAAYPHGVGVFISFPY